MGRQIGEAARPMIQHSIMNARQLVEVTRSTLHLSWDGAIIQARKYMPFAEERFPKFIEELHGIAEGANVSYDELSVVNAMEAVTSDALHLTKCTSMAVDDRRSENGHVLVAHNEDWLPDDEPDVYLVHATPNDEPAWLAMTYGGLLPNVGFNAAGIAQACDSVYPSDSRIGIPRVIASRAVLSARTITEAIRYTLIPRRAAGYSHLLAHDSGELYNIEVSAHAFAVLYSEDGLIAHTNHYLDSKMQSLEKDPDELISTRVRYFRAYRRLQSRPFHSLASLQEILSDHVNYPDSICNHSVLDIDPMDRESTICSLVMDLTDRCLYACWGNPCANTYHRYQLTA